MSTTRGIGLALSGGAARGFAHIGAIKALTEHEVPVTHVAGVSAGAIVGALYCAGLTWREMYETASSLEWWKLIAPTLSGLGLVQAKQLESLIGSLIGDVEFDGLKLPFRAVAVDIASAREVVLSSGSVARAVRASSAVPAIFEPLVTDGAMLVDGGVVNNLPVDLVREMGAGHVVAVDLNADRAAPSTPENLIDVAYRSFAMLLAATSGRGRESADVLIQPDLADYAYHDLSDPRELIDRGESATRAVLDSVTALLG